MQEPLCLHNIVLVSICFRIVLTQIIPRVYEDSLTLTYSIFGRYYNLDTHGKVF